MQIELTDSEATLVRELLDQAFRDLKFEIADTDDSGYKRILRDREHDLARLLDQFGGPLPDTPP